MTPEADSRHELKALLHANDPDFWRALADRSSQLTAFADLLFLSSLRRQAAARLPMPGGEPLRLAVLGGCSLHPLTDAVEHMLTAAGFEPTLFVGEYDGYEAEIRDATSALYAFRPQVTFLVASPVRCRYAGALTDAPEVQRAAAEASADQLLALCNLLHERSDSAIFLANFIPVSTFDPGAFRVKTPGSDWTFRKLVNLELGLRAPSCVHVCDLEFLASRRGLVNSHDDRSWFESKQPCAPDLMLDIAREVAHLARSLRHPPAKVLAVDLDDTLWGGVIGDDGLEGIEIGDTSPRGEAFKAFQRYLLDLSRRGVLLAVCSKNDPARAREPFERHPEMVLRLEHFAAFHANWEPKPENLRAIALELNLGLDSIVLVDDSPAEIDIVRQFTPEVRAILLGPDPSTHVRAVQDSRLFEPLSITEEDTRRVGLYRQQRERDALLVSVTDMDAYLVSLEMQGRIKPFDATDVPRIAQLVNKSNQFNLTTIRRTESEVHRLVGDTRHPAFTIRLTDRFGDHGLISVVICKRGVADLEIETWVMSCRVLQRQVEAEAINEVFRLAAEVGARRVIGRYVQTHKNELARNLFPRLGFASCSGTKAASTYTRDVASFKPIATRIAMTREQP